ncbi:MAG: hypothetical protein WC802_00035 [Patescibacteria group bacterium]|jgi:hypothetical protein
MVHVAVMRGEDRRKTVRKAVDDLGAPLWKACKDSSYLFIKPDLEGAGNLFFEDLAGVLDILRLYSNAPIVIGDAPTFGARDFFRASEYRDLDEKYRDLHLIDLTLDETIESRFMRDEGSEIIVRRAKTAVEAPFAISLTGWRAHPDIGISPATLNWALGTWVVPPRETSTGRSWNRGSWLGALTPAERSRLMAELFITRPCHAGVISGMLSGETVIAGLDPVSADTLALTLMGMDAHSVAHLEQIASGGSWTNEIADLDVTPMMLQELMS